MRRWHSWLLLLWASLGVAPTVRADAPRPDAQGAVERELSRAEALALRLNLAQSRTWWRLLHYRQGWLGVSSEADGPLFFNSPEGKTNPEAELLATLHALFSPGGDRDRGDGATADETAKVDPPYCRFPARRAWLEKRLDLDLELLPRRPCPRLDEFRDVLQAESISLIFSTYYLNNPASAFGHTLLRINKRRKSDDEKRQALLDYGINFGATVDTSNSLLYAIKGLFGLFHGELLKVPYYYKVREYNDYESRDLWEFELDLDQSEVDMAVSHLWELGWTYFDYYYLTENCSYHVLGILEVARPSANLLSKLRWPVIPAETVKAVARSPGLVRKVSFRPSARRQFRERLTALDSGEQDLLAALSDDPDANLPGQLGPDERAQVLDAALDLVDFQDGKELLDPSSPAAAHKQQLLSRRARLGVVSPELEVAARRTESPLAGHETRRLDLGLGHSSRAGYYQSLDLRLALHDLTDPGGGYPDTLSINFLPTRVRYYVEERRLELEQIDLVTITSLAPVDRFTGSLSWSLRAGATRVRDAGCRSCLLGRVQVTSGGAVGTTHEGLLAYVMVGGSLLGLGPLEGGLGDLPLRFGPIVTGGLRWRLGDSLVTLLEGEASYLPFQRPGLTWASQATTRWTYSRNFAVSAEARAQPDAWTAQLASTLYF